MKFAVRGFIGTAITVSLSLILVQQVVGANTSGFNPGRIIDDAVFFNTGSMSVPQIKTFLNSKVTSCDTQGQKTTTWYTPDYNGDGKTQRWEYGKYKGNPKPFTCLKDYYENPNTHANNYDSNSIPDGGKSAAWLIHDAARRHGINPQVLIVFLQKEQGLITDDWPFDRQYEIAMGYGCPDTAPCNEEYYGFANQVNKAAYQLKRYTEYPEYYNHAVGSNYVLWHPDQTTSDGDPSCGGSTVDIRTTATAALYNYTPYQPNQAALGAGYGPGDSCSAYGNRNFYLYFNDWFGSTKGTPFFEISNRIYIHGANNSYYYVPSPQTLRDYGYGSTVGKVSRVDTSYVSGMTSRGALPLVARFEGDEVYAVSDAKLHYFSSPDLFSQYGFQFGDEAQLPYWTKSYLSTGDRMQTILRDENTVYNLEDGKARSFCSWGAYTTLGSPTYSSLPYVTTNNNFSRSLSIGAPILTTGSLLMNTDSGSYGIWTGSELQAFNSTVANESGLSSCKRSTTAVGQLPISADSLDKFAKDSSGSLYIIDGDKKLEIANQQLDDLGLAADDFIVTSDKFLAKFNQQPLSLVFRIDRQSAVYLFANGNRYHVYSRDDLYGLGYSFGDVISVKPSTAQLFNHGGAVFKQGKLVRIGNTSPVYLIGNNFEKKYISSRAIMSDYGYSMDDVWSVSTDSLQSYPTTDTLTRIVKDTSDSFWLASLGKKHRIPTDLLDPTDYDIDQPNTQILSTETLSGVANGETLTNLIRIKGQAPVYLVENGQKRYVTSPSAMESRNLSFSDVVPLSDDFVNSLPNGAPVD